MRLWLQHPDHGQKPHTARLIALILCLSLLFSIPAFSEEEEVSLASTGSRTGDITHVEAPFVPFTKEMVGVEYFQDAVLVGDSLSESFMLSRVLPELTVFSKIGQSANGMLKFRSYTLRGKKVTLMEKLTDFQPKKIYLWAGINGLDRYATKLITRDYEALIDKIQETCPDALLYCMSVAPVRESITRKKLPGLSNRKILRFNEGLKAICLEKGCYYLPVFDALADDVDQLNKVFSAGDGYHLSAEGQKEVAQYLRCHAIGWEGK